MAAYFLLMNVFRRTRDIHELESEKNMIAAQLSTAQQTVNALYRSTEQAAAYRHDLRHHINLISGFIEEKEYEKLNKYLLQVQTEVQELTPLRFCENETVNLLLSSFWGRAEKLGVELSIKANLPKKLDIPDTEICSILSNGLENALNANCKVEDTTLRKVFVDCNVKQNMFLIEIENAFMNDFQMINNIPTSNENGHGYGCRSIFAIADKRKGFCTFKADDGIFTLRVALPLNKDTDVKKILKPL